MIIEREINIYNSNSLNNYMKVERYSYKNDFSEKEFKIMIRIKNIKRLKNKIIDLKSQYQKERELFDIRQLDLLNSKNDSEFMKISEHLSYIRIILNRIDRELKITEKELYNLTHHN